MEARAKKHPKWMQAMIMVGYLQVETELMRARVFHAAINSHRKHRLLGPDTSGVVVTAEETCLT